MSIRSTAKAIILDDDKILLNKCRDQHNGEYYTLPGGGQETFETLHDAIVRECLEETGYTVEPLRFAALCEEICDNADYRRTHPQYAHKMLHIFVCGLATRDVCKPTETDDDQIVSEWVDIRALSGIRLLPQVVGENLSELIESDKPLFLGSQHVAHNHG